MGNGSSERVRFGPFEADLHTHELWKHGLKLKLVGQPFEILAVLVLRPRELVTREELRAKLWPGDTFVDFNHGLNAAMNKLRDALSDSADEPRYIETLPRRGYRFIASVERPPAPASPPAAPEPVPLPPVAKEPVRVFEAPSFSGVSAPSSVAEDSSQGGWFRKVRTPALVTVALVVLTLAAVHLFSGSAEERERKLRAESQQRFVPLTNISDGTREPSFSPDGVRVAFIRQSDQPRISGLYAKGLVEDDMLQLTNDPGDCVRCGRPMVH
jgi:DNA-binding winged helix-turn-helix (wHTH) protein